MLRPGDARAVLVSAWLLTVAMVGYEIVPASVLPLLRADLGIGPAAASWVVSVLFLGMAVGSIPAGLVLDLVDNRRITLVATAGVVVATGWGWWAGETGAYYALLASRLAGGVFFVTAWTACVNLVGTAYSADRQATAIGLLTTAVPVGFAVGQFSGPVLASVVGWTGTMPVFGGLTAVLGLGFWHNTRTAPPVLGTARPTLGDFRTVLTDPVVWAIATLGFVAYSLNLFFNSWMATYVVDRFEVSLALGGLFAAVFPAVGVVSRGSSGVLSDRYFGTARKPVVLLAFLVTAPVVVAVGVVPDPIVLIGLLVVAGFFVQLGVAILLPYVRELVRSNVVGTAVAVLNAVGFLGAFSTPIVAGVLLERSGSYLPMFGYAALLAVLGVVLAVVVPEPG